MQVKDATLLQVFFKHFASKNQRPGFYISGTLVGNGLILQSWETYGFLVMSRRTKVNELILNSLDISSETWRRSLTDVELLLLFSNTSNKFRDLARIFHLCSYSFKFYPVICSFITYAKCSEKLACAYQGVRKLSFSEIFAYALKL